MSGHHAHHSAYHHMGICQATITIPLPSASPRPVLAAAWLPAARPGMLHRGIHTGDTVVSLIETVPGINGIIQHWDEIQDVHCTKASCAGCWCSKPSVAPPGQAVHGRPVLAAARESKMMVQPPPAQPAQPSPAQPSQPSPDCLCTVFTSLPPSPFRQLSYRSRIANQSSSPPPVSTLGQVSVAHYLLRSHVPWLPTWPPPAHPSQCQ